MINHWYISRQHTDLTLLLMVTSLLGGAGGGQRAGTIRFEEVANSDDDKAIRCNQCGGDHEGRQQYCVSYNTCYASPEEGISAIRISAAWNSI
jgi:hypothetical protein